MVSVDAGGGAVVGGGGAPEDGGAGPAGGGAAVSGGAGAVAATLTALKQRVYVEDWLNRAMYLDGRPEGPPDRYVWRAGRYEVLTINGLSADEPWWRS